MSEKNKEYDLGKIEITPEIEEFLRGRDIDKKYQKQQATGIIDPTLKKPELSSDKFLADDGFEVSEKVREKINAHLEALGDKKSFNQSSSKKYSIEDNDFEITDEVREKISAKFEALADKEVFKPNRNMGLKK